MSVGIVFARASFCPWCSPWYSMGTEEIIYKIRATSIDYWDIPSGEVVWGAAAKTLIESNGNCFCHTGHGNADILAGDYIGSGIFIDQYNAETITALSGKAVYALSCLAGSSLLPYILANAPSPCVAGYTAVYKFYYYSSYADPYFQSTWMPGFEFMKSIIDDKTWEQCYQDTLSKFDTELARWVTGDMKNDPLAAIIAAQHLWNKQHLCCYGDLSWHLLGAEETTGTINVSCNVATTFSLSGAGTYSGSGTTWTQADAPVGSYTITYGNVSGYTKPANETKSLIAGGSITFTGTYVPVVTTGTISVTTNRPDATFTLTGPASYNGTGTSWSQASAPAGAYTISYGAIAGYTTPSDSTQTLVAGSSLSFSGTYTLTTGTINVTTNHASATFSLSGAASYSGSGASWSRAYSAAGSYTVAFGAIAGYITPANQTGTLVVGSTLSFNAIYLPSATTSSIIVITNLDAATFSLAGAASYSGSGKTYTNTSAVPGSYTVTYGAVAGYVTPAPTTQTVTAGNIISFTGTYVAVANTGTINLSTNLEAATFTISGQGVGEVYAGTGLSWQKTDADAGWFVCVYGAVAGYITPASEMYLLTAGGTIDFTGTYVADTQVGTITVATNAASASWTLTGPATYTGSGSSWTQADVPVGVYLITYNTLAGYDIPDPESKSLTVGGTIAFSGTYTFVGMVGTIAVITNHASAAFSITGEGTYSGTGTSWSQTDADVGSYTITYSPIVGYNTPASETKFLQANETMLFIGNYVATGSEVVEVSKGLGGGAMSKASNARAYINAFKNMFIRYKSDEPGLTRLGDGDPISNPFFDMPINPGVMYKHSFNWTFSSAADVNSDNWTPGNSGTGTVLTVQDEYGGVAKVINAVTDNAYYYYLRKYGIVKLTAGKDIYLRTRFKVYDADEADLFVGYVKTPSGNIFDNRVDGFGFYMQDGSATLGTETIKDATSKQNTGLLTISDDTYVSLAIHVEGVTRVHFFANTEGSNLRHLASHTTYLPDDEVLTFGFGCRNGKLFTGTGNAMSIGSIKTDMEEL